TTTTVGSTPWAPRTTSAIVDAQLRAGIKTAASAIGPPPSPSNRRLSIVAITALTFWPFVSLRACGTSKFMPGAVLLASLRARLRFDGLWWRKFAYLGCVYGPEWWKRYSPPVIAAIIFSMVGRNRRGAVANLRRVLETKGDLQANLAALRMFAQFAH